MEQEVKFEQLPSGKRVLRRFGEDGTLVEEQHSYGVADIAIRISFSEGVKVDETYIAKKRMVGRKSYEKARVAFPDMPAADTAVEDFGTSLLRGARQQQRQNKIDAERRLAESAESRFPRPASTNWLRVISGEQSHLVVFASRDWKILCREPRLPTGREWLHVFGFDGTLESGKSGGGVAK